jgi:RNA polymerase sigma-70 factor (ECF subfamily)
MDQRDEELMARVAQESRSDLLEPLVRRHANSLLTFLTRMAGDGHQAEELFQEVFLAVWIKRRQYTFPRPFKPWLYAIALNKFRASFRARTLASLPGERDLPAREEATPSDAAIAVETAALVSQAVTRLPPQQRAVVVLRIWEGLPYARIAEIVGRTEATVRSHMHHGLISLRQVLQPLLESGENIMPGEAGV